MTQRHSFTAFNTTSRYFVVKKQLLLPSGNSSYNYMPAHHPVLLLGVINSIQSMQQRQMTRPHASRTRTKCGWAISTVFCCKLVSLLIGCQQIRSNFVSQKITPFRTDSQSLEQVSYYGGCFFRVHKEVVPHFCPISFPKEAFSSRDLPFPLLTIRFSS